MTFNDRIKIFKRAMARNAMFTVTKMIRGISYPGMRRLTKVFFVMAFPFLIKQKRLTRESLNIAFAGEKSPQEVDRIFHDCFQNVAGGMMELMFCMEHPEWIPKMAFFEGKENLDNALKQGRGAIAVSAHFGNFPLMLLYMVSQGYKTNAIIRPTRDQEIEKHFQSLRTRLGLNTVYSIPRKQCVDTSIRVLRSNEVLFIPLDQNFGSNSGVYVDFFGRKAATATGPIIFAMRTGAPLLPVFAVRQKDGRHKIIIEPPLALDLKSTDQETMMHNVSRITRIIETYIRRYPQEWGWMHRRWKSQPTAEQLAVSNAATEPSL